MRTAYHKPDISPDTARRIYGSLQAGLDDYTMDERGDIGSWIRTTCIRGLADVAEMFMTNTSTVSNFEDYFPPGQYHQAIGGILKQGVERLDNVRLQAGQQIIRLLSLPPPNVPNSDRWRIHGEAMMKELFMRLVSITYYRCNTHESHHCSGQETTGWNEGAWLYPRAIRLLDIPEYRETLLAGFVLGASSRTDSTVSIFYTKPILYTSLNLIATSRLCESG